MPDNYIYVELINENDSIISRQKIKRIDGLFAGNILIPEEISTGEYTLRAYSNWMRNVDDAFFYHRNIQILNILDNKNQEVIQSQSQTQTKQQQKKRKPLACTFFPEGGDLLLNTTQTVAFKCLSSTGRGIDVSGTIYDADGDSITSIATINKGMGSFYFHPDKISTYYAKLTDADGETIQFDLPKVRTEGRNICINQVKKLIHYQIKATPTTTWNDTLYLVAHTRGFLMFVIPITSEKRMGSIQMNELPDGITHFLLMTKNGVPISQRLAFIYPEQSTIWTTHSNILNTQKREQTTVDIVLTNSEGIPLSGNFSVSITDELAVTPDSLSDNILSNLLLTSDLKGHIENPGSYFNTQTKLTDIYMNLLMLTHGWSRFDVNLNIPNLMPTFYFEQGQYVAGQIENFIGKGADKATITLLSSPQEIVMNSVTDTKGKFLIDGMDYMNETKFILQARTKKGLDLVNIVVDKETVPKFTDKKLYLDSFLINQNFAELAYEKKINEEGIRVYNLDEVVISGKSMNETRASISRAWADFSMTPEMIAASTARTAHELFRNAMGKNVDDISPLVVIDDVSYQENGEILNVIYPEDILTFDLYKDQGRSSYGSPGKNTPAVVLTLKPDAMNRKKRGIVHFNSLGYSQYTEFYQPEYYLEETKNNPIPDLRTTLLWEPKLKIDSAGRSSVNFYKNDRKTSYQIEIEGITSDGKICRYKTRL